MNRVTLLFSLLLIVGATSLAAAQGPTSSLAQRSLPDNPAIPGGPVDGSNRDLSWYYRELPPPRKIQEYDIVHIRVDEAAEMESEGNLNRRKQANFDALLANWVHLENLKAIVPDEQSEGSPRITGQLNSRYRTQGTLETVEEVRFRVAATVSEIMPNGTLKLEAQKEIQVNNETWTYYLRGVCRVEDIDPNNVVLSERLANLSITKQETGHIRDTYKRGWVLKIWDAWKWF
ncbi:flagellar basal body L-ring protein FlgH [Blastopirellula marina]|uniref:Flagellar biosynthesis protein FlgH n=1 Tax=Blastopirellula marina TaxID=124 RepID=A0A2S8GAH4_9BACT|nr:flagellar basal body L-ring protein FlgH [Blastopirellula marina]PQO35388.1 flagellar biosynthesis protein FlgH [Blastopirellula marina]PQO41443.1 flagellar biosynthesis protein FlgH [Blastopirellula marina]PTL44028.1 flagellar biosynthesis protein FlgH [Blastopirellula marina]